MPLATAPRKLRTRLGVWYVLCAAILIGHCCWFVALRTGGASYGWPAVLLVMIALLALLLATTPADAIRLRRGRSEMLILAGAIVLELGAMLIASRQPLPRIMLTSAAVVLATFAMLRVLRERDDSAWWAALVAWNPLLVYDTGVMGRDRLVIAVLASAALALIVRRNGSR